MFYKPGKISLVIYIIGLMAAIALIPGEDRALQSGMLMTLFTLGDIRFDR